MPEKSFEEKVLSIDWIKYLAPEYHDPERMNFDPKKTVETLIALNNFGNPEATADYTNFESKVMYAIGNDHRGSYYPAALEAIDLIIEVSTNSKYETARKSASAVLNDLAYFELELGSRDTLLYDALESAIKEKLLPYRDDDDKLS